MTYIIAQDLTTRAYWRGQTWQKHNDRKTPKNNTNTIKNTRPDDNLKDGKTYSNYRFLVQQKA